MIIVRLNGGLGNQLFQYAAGFALAAKNQDQLKVDLSAFDYQRGSRDAIRFPDILHFSLSAPMASSEEVNEHRNPWGSVSRAARFFRHRVFKQYLSDWHPEVLLKKGDVYLEGYFQCEKYFENCLHELLGEYRLRTDLSEALVTWDEKIAALPCPVSLHVRRGDYVTDPRANALHNICTVDYYQRAIAEIRVRLGECNLVVFSDDVTWVQKNLGLGKDVLYISWERSLVGESLLASQELVLMSHCRHHIISNSTFSWWGAYMNTRSGKIVIAPALWNRSKVDSHKNILPRGWLCLPVT